MVNTDTVELDVKGYKSVVFGVEPSPLKEGHHRMSPFGLN